MTRKVDPARISTSPVPTKSIPIPIPDAITPVSATDLPSKNVQFIAENLSERAIEKVIGRYYKRFGYSLGVYFSYKTRGRFLVNVIMHFGQITVSDFVSMFAENEPEAVIEPVESVLSAEEAVVEPQSCERFRLLTSQYDEASMGKIVYLKGSEFPSLRTAS